MFYQLSLLFKRLSVTAEDKQQKRQMIRDLISDYNDISNINLVLNAQSLAEDLEMLGEVQLDNRDIIYFDKESNKINIKSLID